MKPDKKSSEPAAVSAGVQQTGKISHWKKMRMKRKLKKQALKNTSTAAASVALNPAVVNHKHGKNSGKRKKKKDMKLKEANVNHANKQENGTDQPAAQPGAGHENQKPESKNKHSEKFKNKKEKWKKIRKARISQHKGTKKPVAAVTSVSQGIRSPVSATNAEKKTSEKNLQVLAELPSSPAEFSSNWKKLQNTLQPKKRKMNASHLTKKRRTEDASAGSSSAENKSQTLRDEVWFDDVDEILLDRPAAQQQKGKETENALVMPDAITKVTKALAMDCEMVGVGKDGEESVLARVSLVNQHGHCVYDKFVKPREKVTDFRTHVSGIRPADLRTAEDFLVVQKEVADLLKGRILVGHALHNDLKVLFLDHPRKLIRDTSQYKPFRQAVGSSRPGLKKLTAKVLGVSVQEGEHSSVQDAQAAMRLYTMHRKRWEQDLMKRKSKKTSAP